MCKNKGTGTKKERKKYLGTICKKIRTFALENARMIQKRSETKNVDQLSGIIAKHFAIGSSFETFDKEEQRFLNKSRVLYARIWYKCYTNRVNLIQHKMP